MPQSTTFDDATQGMADKASDMASQVKEKATDLGRSAAETIDQNRMSAASGLESAASALHDKADSLPGGDKVTQLAHSAADTLNSTATYVKQNDVKSMMDDVEQLVKRNPGPSLVAAAVVGFLVGRAFSSND